MANFSPISLIKRQAKELSLKEGISHAQALDKLAKSNGFSDYHEMKVVDSRSPLETRLTKAALGVSDLYDAIHEGEVQWQIDSTLEDAMSGAIAETNAYMFQIDGINSNSTSYNAATGTLTVEASIQYSGDQDQDRPYHGTTFFIEATLKLVWRNGSWSLSEDDDSLEITGCESDVDRDHEAEQDWEDWMREQHELGNKP